MSGRADFGPPEPIKSGADDFGSPEPVQSPPSATAYAAQKVQPDRAIASIGFAKDTGLSPSWVNDNFDAVKSERELTDFRDELGARPITKEWADQSPEHAAAVRYDMTPLGRIEGWLSGVGDALHMGLLDIGGAEAMREYMGSGGPLAENATAVEEAQRVYDAKDHGYFEQVARAAPQMALYGAATVLGGRVGLTALLYAQNKGVLARRISLAQPLPPEVGAIPLKEGEVAEDTALTPDEVDKYATIGSAVSAITLAGLMTPLVRSLPGAKEGLEGISSGILARAVATTVGKAAIRSILAYGEHSLMGAAGMALQSVVNDATVQKATTGKMNAAELVANGANDFVKVLPIALTFAAYGPTRDFLSERGRINAALANGATVDDMVKSAKESSLRAKAPNLAAELFGLMGHGANVYIDWRAAQKLKLPAQAVAEAEATQGSVPVPVEQYLAHFADDHDSIREDVKLEPNGLTPREANETLDHLREILSPEDFKAIYGPIDLARLNEVAARGSAKTPPDEEVRAASEKLKAALGVEIPEMPPVGGDGTEETVPLHEAMAAEYGGTPEEWAKRLTPELMERLTPKAPAPDLADAAERSLRAKPIGEIQPGRYALAAERASDALTKQTIKSGDLASKRGQEHNAVVSRIKEAELTQARDSARAYADKAAELRETYDKALKKISSRAADGSAYRDTFHEADAAGGGPAFDPVYKGLADAVSGTLPDAKALEALPEVLNRMQARNTPVAFDTGVVTQLLSRGKKWEAMTPAEADHVQVALKNLRTAALREIKVGQENLADAAAQVGWDASVLPKVDEPLVRDNISWWNRVTNFAGAFNARALERLEILKSLGPTVKRMVVDRMYSALETRDQLRREVGEKYTEAVKNLPKELNARKFDNAAMPKELAEAYRRAGLVPNPDRQFLWTTALMWGDGQARQRFVGGLGGERGLSPGGGPFENMVNNWLVDNMSPEEWKLVEHVGGIESGKLWEQLKAKEERKSGVAPVESQKAPIYDREGNKIADGWYFPLARDRRAYKADGGMQMPDGPKSPNDLFGPNYTRPAVQHRFVKERAAQASYVVDLNWNRIPLNIDQVIHDIAFDEPVTDAAKLLLHPEVDKVMKERLGMEKRDQVHAWLYVAANERAEAAKGLGVLQSAYNFLRNRTQSSALGNSLPVIAAMGTHSLLSLVHGEVPRVAGSIDYAKALIPSVRKFALDNSEALRQRQTESVVGRRDDMNLFSSRFQESKVGKGLELAARVAQFGQDFMDHTLGTGYFMAKYNEVMEATHDHEAAKAAGNAMVRDNLQPRTPIEKSMLMNDKGALSAVLIFHGFFNKVYNKEAVRLGAAKAAWDTRMPMPEDTASEWGKMQAEQARGERSAAAWKVAKASGEFLALLGVLSLGKLALGRGREDGENWGQWAARHGLGAAFDLVPLVSNVTQPLLDKAISGHARPVDFRSAPMTAGLQKVLRSVQDAANENKSDRMWNAADAAVMAAGAGSGQYVRSSKYLSGPLATRDLAHMRAGEFISNVMYGQQNLSETFPRLVAHALGGQ